ncbi:MAG: hypothetical protein ACFCVD_19275 [Nodosilinea sp.]
MAENDPVIDTQAIVDRAPSTATAVADKTGITKPANQAAQNKAAKPTVDKLFLYDASLGDDSPTALRDAYYNGAKIVKVKTWPDIQVALSKYSEIGTLIFDTHSIPGNLLIGGNSPTLSDQQSKLAATGAKVTQAIVFEGCSIMADPASTARLVSGIAGAKTRVSGYTFFSVVQAIFLDLSGDEDADGILTALEPHEPYLLPGSKTPQELAGKKGTFAFYKRWFRSDYDETPVSGSPPRGIKLRDDMTPVKVSTPEKAAEVKADTQDSPVPQGYFVTVENITAVIGS